MPKSVGVYTRVEPDFKEEVEAILSKLGLPMSNAIYMFLQQIKLHNGLPFEVKLPATSPPDYVALTEAQFNAEIEKGLSSIESGRTIPAKQVRENMQKRVTE